MGIETIAVHAAPADKQDMSSNTFIFVVRDLAVILASCLPLWLLAAGTVPGGDLPAYLGDWPGVLTPVVLALPLWITARLRVSWADPRAD